jgi:hypothetical protein
MRKKVLLNVYSDTEGESDMDFVMHLMVYLKSIGITPSGLLFPHTEMLELAATAGRNKKTLAEVVDWGTQLY